MRQMQRNGFTLIEVVMTIIVLGIIAGILAPIILNTINASVDTQSRSHLHDKVRVSLGRLSRELRQATVPLTSASGSTLQFTTTTVGGSYVSFNANTPKIATADCSKTRNQVPSQLERFLPNEPIGTLCVLYPGNLASLPAAQRDALVIGHDVASVNSISAQVSGAPDDYDGALWKVQFGSDTTFSSASASSSRIFSLADYQHRITLSGGNLVWERTTASASGFGSADSGILLDNVSSFTTSLNTQAGIVSLSITVAAGSATITVSEDVYVRN